MQFKVLTYEGDHMAIFFEDKNILLHGIEKYELFNCDDDNIKSDYFYYIIQGHRTDRCTCYEDIKDRINIKEVEI